MFQERIRAKAISFDQKTREIIDQFSNLEQERMEEKTRSVVSRKSKFDSDDERLAKHTSRRNESEDKFEKNSSVSSSFGKFYFRISLRKIWKLSFALASTSRRDKKKTRFNDPKERTTGVLVTHVGMFEAAKTSDNGSSAVAQSLQIPVTESRSKYRDSSTSSTSSSGSRHKKHKKHKKSSKHSKKPSKKRNRSRSRERDRDKRKSYKSDRRSIESKSSVRSSESRRHRSRSRSRSRDRRHRRY